MMAQNNLYVYGYFEADSWDLMLLLAKTAKGQFIRADGDHNPISRFFFPRHIPDPLLSLFYLDKTVYAIQTHDIAWKHAVDWTLYEGAKVIDSVKGIFADDSPLNHSQHPCWPLVLSGETGPVTSAHHQLSILQAKIPIYP